jgi:hypothetical protein
MAKKPTRHGRVSSRLKRPDEEQVRACLWQIVSERPSGEPVTWKKLTELLGQVCSTSTISRLATRDENLYIDTPLLRKIDRAARRVLGEITRHRL